MRRCLSIPVGLTVLIVALAGAASPAAAARPARRAATSAGASGALAAPDASRQVLLISGDRVQAVRTAGGWTGGRVILGHTGSLAGSLLTLGAGAQTYLIPAAAVPYLGRGLDPRLFQLSALVRAEATGRLPVQIGYRTVLPTLPGVTITSSGGGTARGYLTTASAGAFGIALDRQYLADHADGGYGTDGLFASGVSIAMTGTAAPPPAARPDYPMSTLTVTGTDAAAQPDTGDELLVFNADDTRRFSDPIESVNVFYHGTTKFSVPTGHYWAIGDFISIVNNRPAAVRLDVLPQFTVSGATTVHLAAQAAASQVTMVTPRPAQPDETDFFLQRDGQSGPPITVGQFGSSPVWVSPAGSPPTVGGLQAYAAQVLFSPAGPGVPYHYEVLYSDPPGVISSQRYVVRPQALAAVSESYYLTQQAKGDWIAPGTLPSGDLRARWRGGA